VYVELTLEYSIFILLDLLRFDYTILEHTLGFLIIISLVSFIVDVVVAIVVVVVVVEQAIFYALTMRQERWD